MRKLPPLNAIRVFEAAARNRSFTAAASELCVSITAISHHIRHLEDTVGVKLFERRGRTITLSPTGERLYPMLRDGFDLLANAFAEFNERKSGAALTVTTTAAFAERWLMPRLPAFTAICPDVVVNVDASEAIADLRSEGIDIAIRYGPAANSTQQDDILLEDKYMPVAETSLCPDGREASIDDFAGRPLLGYRWKNAAFDGPTWSKWLSADGRKPSGDFRVSWFSEEHLAINAAERGFGPVLCSNVLVADQLRDGTLRRLDGPVLSGFKYRLLFATANTRKPARLFAEWLRNEAAASVAAH
ncbi:MAG: LysR family transcriptional regulator [Rhizobiales bacterium]|nr:LysR family transcriptional regulator [Hyphomicrobiales bacterium]